MAVWCSRSVPASCTWCEDSSTRSAERKSLPWVGPAVTTFETAFWSLTIQTMSESLGNSTPQVLSWMTLPNLNKSMRLADRVGSFCTSKALVWQCFLKTLYQSEYETLKFKPLQIEAENVKTRRFEHRCLIWRFCWSFLPSGMVLDFSMFDAVVWYCKTQYRRQHWLEMLYRK